MKIHIYIFPTTDQYFQQGFVYFHRSFYYISSTKKSWQKSREDCLQRGADLVIINTKEEQVCVYMWKYGNIKWNTAKYANFLSKLIID